MKRLNRQDRQAVLHFVTLNVRERRAPFLRDEYARPILFALRECCDNHPAKLIAYVTMPEHMHFINNPRDGKITAFLAQFKMMTSKLALEVSLTLEEVKVERWLCATPDSHAQLWQDGKHSFDLYSDRLIWQKIDYIHNNPIKRSLVCHANEYPYSSFSAIYPVEGEPIITVDRDWWWEDIG